MGYKQNDMGGQYCAIDSPLGPRRGQKSLDFRFRDFCPHLEPRGELFAQYRPPMSFRFTGMDEGQLWNDICMWVTCYSISFIISKRLWTEAKNDNNIGSDAHIYGNK